MSSQDQTGNRIDQDDGDQGKENPGSLSYPGDTEEQRAAAHVVEPGVASIVELNTFRQIGSYFEGVNYERSATTENSAQ